MIYLKTLGNDLLVTAMPYLKDVLVALKDFGNDLWQAVPYAVVLTVILILAKLAKNLFTSYKDNEELFDKDNPAIGIATAGYYFGIMIAAFLGVMAGGSRGLALDLLDLGVYGVAAILYLNLARLSADKFILNKFSITKELVKDENKGTAWVMFGVYIAGGWVVYGAIAGEPTNLLSGILNSAYWFVFGQLALILGGKIYQKCTPYDFHELIEKDNEAAGLALGGYLAALGTIIGHSGNLQIALDDTVTFALLSIVGAVALGLFARLVVAELILVPGHKIADEIVGDKNNKPNTNAGWMAVVAYQMVAWMFVVVMM